MRSLEKIRVLLTNTSNEAGFSEKELTDNKDNASIIIAIGTGEKAYIVIAGAVMLVMISAGVVIYRKKK